MAEGHASAVQRIRAFASSSDLRQRRARSIAEAIRAAGAYHWVGLHDVTATRVEAIGWTGQDPPAQPFFPVTQGLAGAAIAAGEPAIVQDVGRDPRPETGLYGTAVRAAAVLPVTVAGAIVGTLEVHSDRVDAFAPRDSQFLRDCTQAMAPLWVDDTIDEI